MCLFVQLHAPDLFLRSDGRCLHGAGHKHRRLSQAAPVVVEEKDVGCELPAASRVFRLLVRVGEEDGALWGEGAQSS